MAMLPKYIACTQAQIEATLLRQKGATDSCNRQERLCINAVRMHCSGSQVAVNKAKTTEVDALTA
jgi:hypothetical protein